MSWWVVALVPVIRNVSRLFTGGQALGTPREASVARAGRQRGRGTCPEGRVQCIVWNAFCNGAGLGDRIRRRWRAVGLQVAHLLQVGPGGTGLDSHFTVVRRLDSASLALFWGLLLGLRQVSCSLGGGAGGRFARQMADNSCFVHNFRVFCILLTFDLLGMRWCARWIAFPPSPLRVRAHTKPLPRLPARVLNLGMLRTEKEHVYRNQAGAVTV